MTRHSWAVGLSRGILETATCRKCGLERASSGYDLERSYALGETRWYERAPSCPPTGEEIAQAPRLPRRATPMNETSSLRLGGERR
jgi:hypothetical protein